VRVLVTGAGGLLGGRLAELLHRRGLAVLAQWRRSPPPAGPRPIEAGLGDPAALASLLDRTRPDAVVHAAALARVEVCHDRPLEAEAVNAVLPGTLGALCRQRRIRLVALSTDMVLPGDCALSSEELPARPLSVYGRSKLAGEEAVLADNEDAAVVRVALVIGRGHGERGSASEAVAWGLRDRRRPFLFRDEHRTPVDPESVADAVARLIERPSASGRFHLGGSERLSRYELGLRTARALGLDATAIVEGSQADRPSPEPRPADLSLDSTRAERELGWQPRALDEALRETRLSPP
jgi:dTDP-4-dehydrorhamnose reductase